MLSFVGIQLSENWLEFVLGKHEWQFTLWAFPRDSRKLESPILDNCQVQQAHNLLHVQTTGVVQNELS